MLRVPGSSDDLFRVKSAGGDVRVVYSPLDALDHRPGEPGPRGGLLRHRLRDHRAGQRDDGLPGPAAGRHELLAAGLARAGAAGDRRDHGVAALPGAGLPRRRARVQRDGLPRTTRRWPRSTACRSWSPASSRWTSSRGSAARWSSSRRAGTRSRTPTRARCATRATRPPWRCCEDVFEVTDRTWRGIGMIPQSGWRLVGEVPRLRRRAPLRGHRHPHRGVAALPLRRGAPGADQAARVRGVRQGVHAAQPARRDDGLLRGRLRRLLHLPPARAGGRLMSSDDDALDFEGWICPVPAARHPDDRDGARRRRGDVGRAGRAAVPARVRRGRARRARRLGGARPCRPGRLAFSTDSFVVKPMFFPGGSIGDLAVNGTVNDLAMSGAHAAVPVDGVHPRGGHRRWTTSAGSRRRWARRPRRPGCGWSPATPRSSTAAAATASTSTPPASA